MTATTTTIRIGELAAHMTADHEIPQSVRASVEALCALSAIPVVALPPDAAPRWADLWPEWRQLVGRVVQHHEASACCSRERHEVLRAVLTYAIHAARVAMHPTGAAYLNPHDTAR